MGGEERPAGQLHQQSPPLVHRDLKSLNVLLHEGTVKLADLGLVEPLVVPADGGSPQILVEPELRTAGSWRYMAPEAYDATLPLTEKVDVWALGCVISEVFSRALPYADCNNAQQVAARVLVQRAPPQVADCVPAEVARLIRSCYAWEAESRPSATEVLRDLAGTCTVLD